MPKNLSQLTSPEAVQQALLECDELGRDAFLKKYGYKNSRLYPLHHNGRVYDSKAIVGVAFGMQHGKPLKANEFSGGADTVLPVLARLGYPGSTTKHPAEHLIVGEIYYRKNLVELFGGQLQAGIWTPKEFPVIFIFSGQSGKRYGYEDGWTNTGLFQYTGEGQTGDMTFTGGNRAIRDHRKEGKDLLLFMDLGKGKGVRYVGLFDCVSWRQIDGVDKAGKQRRVLIFDLIPAMTTALDVDFSEGTLPSAFNDLRRAAIAASVAPQVRANTSDAKRSWYERSALVRAYVLSRGKGICEACGMSAPFSKKDGTPYLETHHTTRLADGGPDDPASVGAICPNCHRRIHSGGDGDGWNQYLQHQLREKEEKLTREEDGDSLQ